MIGIIAGSGLYNIEGMTLEEKLDMDTPFGKPSAPVMRCRYKGNVFFFLPRHGSDHTIAPHKVNYRANVWILKQLGVKRIISISAVGGINTGIHPGSIMIGDQILDFTKSRAHTFFEDDDVVHVDFSEPYCSDMQDIIINVSRESGLVIVPGGTYVAVEGPRLETAAEIAYYRTAGADVVGMTAMPEAALAREAEICYAGVYIVTNYAAGLRGGRLTTDEVITSMKESTRRITVLLTNALLPLYQKRRCECGSALRDARL